MVIPYDSGGDNNLNIKENEKNNDNVRHAARQYSERTDIRFRM